MFVSFVCVDLTCQILQNKTGETFKADCIFDKKSPLGCLCDLFMLLSIFKFGQYLLEKNQMGWLSNKLQDCKAWLPGTPEWIFAEPALQKIAQIQSNLSNKKSKAESFYSVKYGLSNIMSFITMNIFFFVL